MKGSHKEVHQDYFLINNRIIPAEEFHPSDITKTTSVYEVIRIIDGIPLFLEEHLERLNKSFKLLGFDFSIVEEDMEKQICKLIKINQCHNYNVKLIVNNLHTPTPNVFLFFIQSNYPEEAQYEKGVHAILYHGERENPNAKVVLKDFRQRVEEAIRESHGFEAILVNQHHQITEGSRSNIFVVKGNHLCTAPAEKVLMGVTRNRIIALCKTLGLTIEETPLSVDFLKSADGIFMTGTSPKVLPIATVDDIHYNSAANPIILEVRKAYDDLIENYIRTKS
ncbi:branched-chain amino acid aminotransferase [Anaerovirgula multivorans]|uniref:Branched-chain amino acid aminotransferase n=1 Tax=Anaerovirgula multivorans TaxID=312168 RepID=A0A239EUL9_9FIRM|nr:aminotransferase class IV [Anaerovirgula multivorans]SNS48355.1 branched-chain amino acid aminotransferase [Anaerovirgula multivorans]